MRILGVVALGLVGCLAAGLVRADDSFSVSTLWTTPLGTPAVLGSAEATTSYDNLKNFKGIGFSNAGSTFGVTFLIADDIFRTGSAGDTLSDFVFTVANNNSIAVSVRANIRLYASNGVNNGPGTYLAGYSVDPKSFAPNMTTGVQVTLNGTGPELPTHFWAGISFDNIGTSTTNAQLNQIGQGVFDPPTIGSSQNLMFGSVNAGDFPVNNPTGSLSSPGNFKANFGWRFNTVPTPGALALFGLGGLAAGRRRR